MFSRYKVMFGALFGDIIGSTYESVPAFGSDFDLFPASAHWTDDSVLTIATTVALRKCRELGAERARNSNHSIDDISLREVWPDALTDDEISVIFRECYAKYAIMNPRSGFGGMFYEKWLVEKNFVPYNSFGNGSAMRVSPVGEYFIREEQVLRFAKLSSAVTHDHPEGVKAAQAVALAVFLARRGCTKREIRDRLVKMFGYDEAPYLVNRQYDEVKKGSVWSERAMDSVPEAIICFLESTSFEDCVRKAVFLQGDADTQAAIAGSIAYSYYKTEVPEHIVVPGMRIITGRFNDEIRAWQRDEQTANLHHNGDGFINCEGCKKTHWGVNGAAGMLIAQTERKKVKAILLQLRSLDTIMGGTWGNPGGAIDNGESDEEGALREAYEEANVLPENITVLGKIVRDHINWKFTTFLAVEDPECPIDPADNDNEAVTVRWVRLEELDEIELLPALKDELPELLHALEDALQSN
jgi:ADP-ribosylglycohydrolase/8-oxo-dGTP pyrophosphatase MutT (NUDIX family)